MSRMGTDVRQMLQAALRAAVTLHCALCGFCNSGAVLDVKKKLQSNGGSRELNASRPGR